MPVTDGEQVWPLGTFPEGRPVRGLSPQPPGPPMVEQAGCSPHHRGGVHSGGHHGELSMNNLRGNLGWGCVKEAGLCSGVDAARN